MKDNKILNEMMSSPKVKSLGLKKEAIASILESYNNIFLNTLLEYGHIEIENGMNIEVVRLVDRVHVLRGISYHSSRKYKLKLTMEDKLYQKIEEYYDTLQEEIG